MNSFVARATTRLLAAIAFSLIAMASASSTDEYTGKPITLVVPNPVGGGTDQLARILAEELSKRLKQTIIVSNIGGGSGAIGAKRVIHALPDGQTLLFGTTSDMLVTPITNSAAGYSPADFTPVAMIGKTPMALVARAGLGIKTVDELVRHARHVSKPPTLGFTGGASLQAFAAAAFTTAARIDLVAVPYRGGAQIVTDLMGGQIDLAIIALPGVLDLTRRGDLVMLGILSDARSPAAPDVPTVNESVAVKGVAVEIWVGLAGPPRLPQGIVDRINRAVQEILTDKAMRDRRSQIGEVLAQPGSAAVFRDFLAEEEGRYRALAAGAPGIR
jgi:tripartite-type tricarboxylate transporter receptor subunit TctC